MATYYRGSLSRKSLGKHISFLLLYSSLTGLRYYPFTFYQQGKALQEGCRKGYGRP
jgi:hypothetical protein